MTLRTFANFQVELRWDTTVDDRLEVAHGTCGVRKGDGLSLGWFNSYSETTEVEESKLSYEPGKDFRKRSVVATLFAS